MNFLHTRHHFDFAYIEVLLRPYAAENGLARAGRAMNFKAHSNELIDHMLDERSIFGKITWRF